MSLADRISAGYRWPSWTVRLDGRIWRHVQRGTLSQSYGSGITAGDLEGRDPPVSVVEGQTTVTWSWGYDGFEVTGFTGIVTKVLQRSYPNRISLAVADPLWLADIRRSDIATTPLNNITAKAAVEQILSNAGVTRLNIPAFPASGSAWSGGEWVLGTLTPVAWQNTTALSAARSICEALGYWLFADAGGTVQAVAMERAPTDAPFRTLRYGVDFLLAGPPERSRDAASVKNRVVVRGANTGVEGAQIVDARQTGAADRTYEYSNSLIEYVNASQAGNASAESVTARLLSLWSRQPNIITVGRLKADPRLRVGMTIAVECSLIGLASARPFFIYGVTTTMDAQAGAFHQSLTLDGGIGDGGYTTIPPPIAGFTWDILKETLNGTGVIELLLDGSSSLSLTDGEIVAWAWSTSTATALGTPNTASGVLAMFVYPGSTTTADVTLTVTDTSSKQTTLTQTINLLGDELVQPTSSVISLALGSAWAVTPDGGATWNVEATGDATMVPERGPLVATVGTGSVGIRSTEDALSTASTTVDADLAGGLITAMGYTPDSLRQWAAVGTRLYRSLDNWTTSVLWGTLPATITAIIEDPALENSVFVLASNSLYQSAIVPTPGTTWFALYTGPTGATARHLARGASGATTWIAFTGTFTGSPLHRVEGPLTASFPVLSPTVNEIRAMALSPDETTVYCWDQAGRGFSVDSTTGLATALSADLASGETAQHATHDDEAPIVYLASFGATEGTTYKYLPLVSSAGLLSFYTPATGQQAHRVGIGEPLTTGEIEVLLLPWGASGTADRIWRYDATANTWGAITPPQAGWYWACIAANPFNRNEWVLIGNNANNFTWKYDTLGGPIKPASGTAAVLYHTFDRGVTWSPVTLTGGTVNPAGNGAWGFVTAVQGSPAVTWRSDARWALGGGYNDTGVAVGRLWVGSGTSVTQAATTTDHVPSNLSASTGGRLCYLQIGPFIGGALNTWYGFATSDLTLSAPGGTTPLLNLVEALPGGAGVVALRTEGQLWYAGSNVAAAPSLLGFTDGRHGAIAAATHGVYGVVAAGSPPGILRITDILGTPATSTVGDATSLYRAIRADRATQTLVGALSGTTSLLITYSRNGTEWTTLAGPSGMTSSNTAAWIEVIDPEV